MSLKQPTLIGQASANSRDDLPSDAVCHVALPVTATGDVTAVTPQRVGAALNNSMADHRLQQIIARMEARARSNQPLTDTGNTSSPTDCSARQFDADISRYGFPKYQKELAALVPRAFLRCELFGVSRTCDPFASPCDNAPLAALSNICIRFSGYRLPHAYLDVWCALMRFAVQQNSLEICLTPRQILGAMKRHCGGSDRRWLRQTLNQLSSAKIDLTFDGVGYCGPLIGQISETQAHGRETFIVQIDRRLGRLFGAGAWVALDLRVRNVLRRRPTAQWLHCFYSSHAISANFSYSVETLRGLCGSSASLSHFREILERAILSLTSATGWTVRINERDCVTVQRR